MLMTVLKGELAVKQSIALIKAFKSLKDAAIADWAFEGDLSITAIEFEDTMEQWGKVSKSEFGSWYSPERKETVRAVNCSDGDVAIREI